MKNKPIVIFGASSGGQKVAKALESMNIEIAFFVDNGSSKWGTEVLGKKVYNPEKLKEQEYRIIIASEAYQEEIERQLGEMGVLQHCILREELIYNALCSEKERYLTEVEQNTQNNPYITYLFELNEGYELGGVPSWTYTVAQDLRNQDKKVMVVSNRSEELPLEYSSFTTQMDISYETYSENIKKMVRYIAQNCPCRIFASRQHELMWAGMLLKEYYNMDIEIVSVVHNDRVAKYRRHQYLAPRLDAIFCVGSEIKNKLINAYGISEKKVWFKESPIQFEYSGERTYHTVDEAIHICLASRIVVPQKRFDYMIPLIEKLEEKNIDYKINIAGEGEYKPVLENYIHDKNLQHKVILHGRIEHEQMKDFYLKNDVFVQLSDFEGCGLSMLEAMLFGTVPVITKVSGAQGFVVDNETGFDVPLGDMQKLADRIELLALDRNLLREMGSKCSQLVESRCNNDAYLSALTQSI